VWRGHDNVRRLSHSPRFIEEEHHRLLEARKDPNTDALFFSPYTATRAFTSDAK